MNIIYSTVSFALKALNKCLNPLTQVSTKLKFFTIDPFDYSNLSASVLNLFKFVLKSFRNNHSERLEAAFIKAKMFLSWNIWYYPMVAF